MKVAVIGGSIGGLSAATVLHRLGCEVKVFEKSATPFKGRGGSIGYCNVPLWEEIAGRRMLRRGVQASRAQGAYVYGDLWNYWNDCLPAGTISYNQTITELGDDSLHPTRASHLTWLSSRTGAGAPFAAATSAPRSRSMQAITSTVSASSRTTVRGSARRGSTRVVATSPS